MKKLFYALFIVLTVASNPVNVSSTARKNGDREDTTLNKKKEDSMAVNGQNYFTFSVDHTKVAGNLSEFTAVFDLGGAPSAFWDHVQSADDIALFDSNNEPVPAKAYEFDTDTHTGVLWFRADLSNAADDIFTIHYNGATALESGLAADAAIRSPMGSQPLHDVSGNGNDADQSYSGVTPVAGKVGKGLRISNATIGISDSQSLDIVGSLTLSMWIKSETLNATSPTLFFQHDQHKGYGYDLLDNGPYTDEILWKINESGYAYTVTIARSDLNDGQWHLMTGVYDAATHYSKLYMDGVQVGSKSGVTMDTGTMDVLIGGDDATIVVDELSLETVARSPQWIQTIYNNQNDISGFYSNVGAEQAVVITGSPQPLRSDTIARLVPAHITAMEAPQSGLSQPIAQPAAGRVLFAGRAVSLYNRSVIYRAAGHLQRKGLAENIKGTAALQKSTAVVHFWGVTGALVSGSVLRNSAGYLRLVAGGTPLTNESDMETITGVARIAGLPAGLSSERILQITGGAITADGLPRDILNHTLLKEVGGAAPISGTGEGLVSAATLETIRGVFGAVGGPQALLSVPKLPRANAFVCFKAQPAPIFSAPALQHAAGSSYILAPPVNMISPLAAKTTRGYIRAAGSPQTIVSQSFIANVSNLGLIVGTPRLLQAQAELIPAFSHIHAAGAPVNIFSDAQLQRGAGHSSFPGIPLGQVCDATIEPIKAFVTICGRALLFISRGVMQQTGGRGYLVGVAEPLGSQTILQPIEALIIGTPEVMTVSAHPKYTIQTSARAGYHIITWSRPLRYIKTQSNPKIT